MVIPIAIGKADTKDLKSFGHCGLPATSWPAQGRQACLPPVGLREAGRPACHPQPCARQAGRAGSILASGIHD